MAGKYFLKGAPNGDVRRASYAAGVKARRAARIGRRVSVPYVRTAVAGENKYFDTERSETALVATAANWASTTTNPNVGTPNTFIVPIKGTSINNRVGRTIYVKKIKIRGLIRIPAQVGQGGADEATNIRMLLVQDSQTNATQAVGTDVMQTPTTGNAFHVNQEFQSLNNFGRFRVLKDKQFTFQNPTMGTIGAASLEQSGMIRHFNLTHVFKKPVKVQFNATNGGTIADVVDNSWSMFVHCSNIAFLNPVMSYDARVVYTE